MLERGKMDRDLVEFVVIDQLVPKEHLLRKIDAAVDFTQLYEMVEPLYCEDNGRPSIAPVVFATPFGWEQRTAFCRKTGSQSIEFHSTNNPDWQINIILLAGQPAAQRPLLCQSVQKLYPVSSRGNSRPAA